MKYLIEQGAEIEALDIGDNTPLHWASMRGKAEVQVEHNSLHTTA